MSAMRMAGLLLAAVLRIGMLAALSGLLLVPAAAAPDGADERSDRIVHGADWWSLRLAGLEEGHAEARRWWASKLEALFAGIELSPAQLAAVDAALAGRLRERGRWADLMREREQARSAGDQARAQELAGEIEQLRTALHPANLMVLLREPLASEQTPVYDMNRARLFQSFRESIQQAREERRQRARELRTGSLRQARQGF